MLSRLVRGQLIAFLVVTVVGLTTLAVGYAQLPRLLGFGVYPLSVALPDASGLYPNANVTYRGVEVGTVTDLALTNRGVVAELSVDDGVRVPADVIAEVHSISAVGEQFVDLVPQSPGGPYLEPGDRIPAARTTTPVGTGKLLEGVHTLLESVPQESLRTTIDELYRAFSGSSNDLDLLLDSATRFQDAASANLEPTVDLINQLVPVLRTQRQAERNIRSYTSDLAWFTQQLVDSDADLRQTIQEGTPLSRQAEGLFEDLRGPLPVLLADLATTGRVLRAYLPGIEHILIILPALASAGQSVVPPAEGGGYAPAKLNVELTFNTPPYCTEGFEYADQRRAPSNTTPAPVPQNSYCKVPHDDPRVVRGVRNFPCPNDPTRRAVKAAGCGLVFDRVRVPDASPTPRSLLATVRGSVPDPGRTARYNPANGHVLAPNGQFFQVAELVPGATPAGTWQELLTAPLR